MFSEDFSQANETTEIKNQNFELRKISDFIFNNKTENQKHNNIAAESISNFLMKLRNKFDLENRKNQMNGSLNESGKGIEDHYLSFREDNVRKN